ncbi:hypothetical protein [Mucilaginibacter terrae]|uniref:Uncharacterized protein n=1 Tax=Mucilaginibacter terrae TaxID=1955052 RepID=A0ABU3GU18_9SPHI|nr:hypothetical protein [Mucilaginibacter terrae]MDT3403277.1 hypothetical protein [Mucilaginibacter terrae]
MACRGTGKFKITGSYFKELGETYDSQNPIYTLRTFAENVSNMDGTKPYDSLEGGMLGVLAGEMDYFKDFSRKWYGNELSADAE